MQRRSARACVRAALTGEGGEGEGGCVSGSEVSLAGQTLRPVARVSLAGGTGLFLFSLHARKPAARERQRGSRRGNVDFFQPVRKFMLDGDRLCPESAC